MLVPMRRTTAALVLSAGLLSAPVFGTAVADPGVTPWSGSSNAVQADAPRLASVDNFRDIAGIGAGYQAQDGDHVNKGVIYRSNALTPNDADLVTLTVLRLATVYDLRSDQEIAAKPDRLPIGAGYLHIPILSGNVGSGASKIQSPEDAREFMRDINRSFVTGEGERAGFAQLLTHIAGQQAPVVLHCTAGKDRTGWAAYLLQSLAGVAPETMMNDYLLTNEYTAASTAAMSAQITAARGPEAAANYAPLFGVEASFLEASIAQVAADYGTLDKYLRVGLGLSSQTIQDLRQKLIQ